MRFSFGVWLRFAAVNVSSHQARAAINGWSLVELELADTHGVCVCMCVLSGPPIRGMFSSTSSLRAHYQFYVNVDIQV